MENRKMTAYELRILGEINRRFAAGMAENGVLKITMKVDGQELWLTPCFTNPDHDPADPIDILDAEYILVHGKGPAIYMSGDPASVCHNLATYNEIKAEFLTDVEKLRAFREKHMSEPIVGYENENFNLYSDWHKDVVGYRPNGWEFDRLGNLA